MPFASIHTLSRRDIDDKKADEDEKEDADDMGVRRGACPAMWFGVEIRYGVKG